MTVEDVTKRSHIEFPKVIHLERLEDLLKNIANNLSCDIRYEVKTVKGIYKRYPRDLQGEIGPIDVSGSIVLKTAASDSFSCGKKFNDYTRFSSLDFMTIPGYDLEEHRKEVVELWDNVRKQIELYFLEKSKMGLI